MSHGLVENYMISCLNHCSWVLTMLMHLYQNGHQRSYRYAEDYLNYENSTSILLMLSKYHEFWVIIFHSANYILHAWIWSQGCIKNTREKWTGNLTNCFELCYCTKYLWYKKGCQRSAEQMISNCWEIAALNPRSNKNWLSQVNCSCRN